MNSIFNLFDLFFSFLRNSTDVSIETLYLIIVFMLFVILGLFLANIFVIIFKKLGF